MQEIITLAKSGKKPSRTYSHKEFMRAIKGKPPEDMVYEKCSEDAKQRWLDIVNKNKNKH